MTKSHNNYPFPYTTEILFLSSNKLTGTIPKAISRLSRTLRGLYMSDNDFEGTIPTQMCIFNSLGTLFQNRTRYGGEKTGYPK